MKRRLILKCAAVLLAALFVSQSAAAAFGAQSGAQTYIGTVLAAVNTDYKPSTTAKKTFEAEMPDPEENEAGQNAVVPQAKKQPWELLSEQIEPMTYEESLQAQRADGTVEAQRARVPYRVGDTMQLPKYPELPDNYDEMSVKEAIKWLISYARSSMELTCVYTDDVCTIWIEDQSAWQDASIRELAVYLDTMIPRLENLFGDVRIDTDKDGKFAIFIHSMPQSEVIVDKNGGTAVGYFVPLDLVDASGKIGDVRMREKTMETLILSAHADCFHVNMEYTNMSVLKDVFVHEYQHYIHECYNYAGKDNRTYLNTDDTNINEGFSAAAEMILYPTDWRQEALIESFNELQDGFSLVTWEDNWANYGLVFPFFQYIRTRYAALTGDEDSDYPGKGIYKRVMQTRDRSNQDNTLGIIADILYPADRYASLPDTDARCRQLIVDFWLAVFYKNPEGEHGFNGEKWAEELCVRTPYFYKEQTLRNGMAAFCIVNEGKAGTATILRADDGIRFIAIEEPIRSVTLDPNGGYGKAATYANVRSRFTLPTGKEHFMYRKGYGFAGWAPTADAEEAVYVPGEQIALQSALTLYAVWKPADKVEVDKPYAFDVAQGRSVTVEFIPPQDGVYYLDSETDYSAVVLNPEREFEEYPESPDDGVYLIGGTTYSIWLEPSAAADTDRVTGSFTLKQRTEYYTVRYYLEPSDVEIDCSYVIQEYGTKYIAPEHNNMDGRDFAGWSTDPNAAEPMYLPGGTVTVTADTVLYAVWTPWLSLQPGVPCAVENEFEHLRFTPAETATYRIQCSVVKKPYRIGVYSGDDLIDDLYIATSVTRSYTMYAGQTYYIKTYHIDSVCVELVSKTLQHTLTLCVLNGLTGKPIRSVSVNLTGKTSYTLPKTYTPVSLGYDSFAYWLDLATGKDKYYPGDTLELDRDVCLVAVGSQIALTEDEQANMAALFGGIVRIIVQYIPMWLRFLAQRVRTFGFSGVMTSRSVPWVAFG